MGHPRSVPIVYNMWTMWRTRHGERVCTCHHRFELCVWTKTHSQIFSDIVFAEKNFMDANFSKEGMDYYLRLRAQMLSLLPAPHVVLYLDVPPEECYSRIHKLRKRVSGGPVTVATHAVRSMLRGHVVVWLDMQIMWEVAVVVGSCAAGTCGVCGYPGAVGGCGFEFPALPRADTACGCAEWDDVICWSAWALSEALSALPSLPRAGDGDAGLCARVGAWNSALTGHCQFTRFSPVYPVSRVQDCEDGIPLEYLSGLDACYGNFLRAMQTTGASVLSIPWTMFGDAAVVADAIRSMPAGSLGEWASDMKRIMYLYVTASTSIVVHDAGCLSCKQS